MSQIEQEWKTNRKLCLHGTARADSCPGAALDALLAMTVTLRKLSIINPYLPTVALVGAPNVGKSSLVRALSSGKPEVCQH